jgi:hypothetical protein
MAAWTRRSGSPGPEAAEEPYLGPLRPDARRECDRRPRHSGVAGRADRHPAGYRPQLICRTHRGRWGDKRKKFIETDYARFLDRAHQQLNGPLVLVWDSLNTHTSRATGGADRRPELADGLPDAALRASELNPVEPVWSNLKRSLANLVTQDIGQLTALVKTRLRRMQYRPGPLDGFLAKTGLDLTPLQ